MLFSIIMLKQTKIFFYGNMLRYREVYCERRIIDLITKQSDIYL